MKLYRTKAPIEVQPVEVLVDGGDWDQLPSMRSEGGLILTHVTDTECDMLKDFQQNYDPTTLRGILIDLHLDDRDEGDPERVNLMALPHKGSVIRHMDRYYLVNVVVQGTNCSAAVFVSRLTSNELWKQKGAVALRES